VEIFLTLALDFANSYFAESCILRKNNAYFIVFLIDFAKSKGFFEATGRMHSSVAGLSSHSKEKLSCFVFWITPTIPAARIARKRGFSRISAKWEQPWNLRKMP